MDFIVTISELGPEDEDEEEEAQNMDRRRCEV